MKQRWICLVLSLLMLLSAVPSALAEDGEEAAPEIREEMLAPNETAQDAEPTDADANGSVSEQEDLGNTDKTELSEEEPKSDDESESAAEVSEEAAAAVRVRFILSPETACLKVYPEANENEEPEEIEAQADGDYLLLPGEYTYTAEAEGYVPAEEVAFSVTPSEEPLEIAVKLKPEETVETLEPEEAAATTEPEEVTATPEAEEVAAASEEEEAVAAPEPEEVTAAPESERSSETTETVKAPEGTKAEAEPEQELETEIEPKKPESDLDEILARLSGHEIDLSEVDIPSSEKLAEGYIRETLRGSSRKKESLRIGAEIQSAGNHLAGNNAVIYSKLNTYISQVAAGNRSKTTFDITAEELGWSWTAKQLGVSSILSGGDLTEEAMDAIVKRMSFAPGDIMTALLFDNPYDFYWFDKTKGVSSDVSALSIASVTNSKITWTGYIRFRFTVHDEYAISAYEFDTTWGKSVQKSVTNAKRIVAKYADRTDYEKLDAYRTEICSLVSYNTVAAEQGNSYPSGNPWQLIWVFDRDNTTDVVCEGYAKAFQYLCDLSSFRSKQIRCYSVTGWMGYIGGERHMWNVVRMDDGKNYLVDITNCDSGSFGEPDFLFLAGRQQEQNYGGYLCNLLQVNGGSCWFIYDEDTMGSFPNSEIALSNKSYYDRAKLGWQKINGRWYYSETVGTRVKRWKKIDDVWYFFDASFGAMQTGWQKIGEKWYYFLTSGAMQTGWQKINNKWYYFNTSGVMQTGWQKIGEKWYYLNGSGVMLTGWQKLGEKWYYLNGSGVMQTGWQKINNKWYYLNSAGVMQTGWQKIGTRWYYLNRAGVMQTGWLQLAGRTYYLNASGIMLTGTHTIDGVVYTFNQSGILQ